MVSNNTVVVVGRHLLLPGGYESLSSLLGLFSDITWAHGWMPYYSLMKMESRPGSPHGLCQLGRGWSHSSPMGFGRSRVVTVLRFFCPTWLLLSRSFRKREQPFSLGIFLPVYIQVPGFFISNLGIYETKIKFKELITM